MTYSLLGTDTDTDTGQPVYLPKTARTQGLYIIGLQGTGKSGLLENLIMQDIDQQIGVCVLDPHGELVDNIIAWLPEKAEDKVIFLDIENYRFPFGVNLFECPDPTDPGEFQRTLDRVRHVFEKLLGVSTETRLILDYLENCTHTLIVNQGYTMADIELLLTDKHCRQRLLAKVKKPQVLRFWQDYEAMSPSEQRKERSYILRRVNDFMQALTLPIVGQSTTTIDMQHIMNEGKILLVKLSPRFPYVTDLIGSLMVALLLNAAYNRPVQRRQFHLYADEFERFATEDFAELLEQARKFGIGTTIAHQNRSQLSAANSKLETDLKARSRSAGTLVVFKINSEDAEDLAGERNLTPPPFTYELIDVEDGTETIETPAADPLHFLMHQGSHPDERVNAVVRQLTDVNKRPRPILTTLFARANAGVSFDELLQAEQEKQAFLDSWRNRLAQLYWEQYRQSGYNAFLLNFHPYFYTSSYADAQAAQFGLYKRYHSPLDHPTFEQLQQIGLLRETGDQLLLQLFSAADNPKGSAFQAAANSFAALVRPLYPNWYLYLKWQLLEKVIHHIYERTILFDVENWLTTIRPVYPWLVRRAQVTIWRPYWEPAERNQRGSVTRYARSEIVDDTAFSIDYEEVERKLPQEADEAVASERAFVEQFLIELAYALTTLARDPVRERSGLAQPRIRKHPVVTQYSTSEMKGRVANEFSSLPLYTAWVKLGEPFPQNPGKKCLSCGLLNPYGALTCQQCGTLLPAPNEYLITTIKPKEGLYGNALQDRIESILERNIRDKHVRRREEVEAEISQRQAQCLQNPQLPRTEPPQPPEEEPPISRREPR